MESGTYWEVWRQDPVSVRVRRRRRNSFVCASITIQDDQDCVAVERGDSLGVLLEVPALFLVGVDGVEVSEQLGLQDSRLLFADVATSTQSIPVAEFSVVSARMMHLYATIRKSMFTKMCVYTCLINCCIVLLLSLCQLEQKQLPALHWPLHLQLLMIQPPLRVCCHPT